MVRYRPSQRRADEQNGQKNEQKGQNGQNGRRVYLCLLERRRGGAPRERKLFSETLLARSYDVIASPRSGVSGRWAEAEMEAAVRRYEAPVPETLKSLSVSLGRTFGSVQTKVQKMTNPAFTALVNSAGGRQGHKAVGWRSVVSRAFQRLPDQRGTAHAVFAEIEKMPGVTLDWSIEPGAKTTSVWIKRAQETMSRHPEFVSTDERVTSLGVHDRDSKPLVIQGKMLLTGLLLTKSKSVIWQYVPPKEGAGTIMRTSQEIAFPLRLTRYGH